MPTGVGVGAPVGDLGQAEQLQQLTGPPARPGPAEVVQPAACTRFSRPLAKPSTAANCPVSPIRSRTCGACFSTSYPAMVAVPESGLSECGQDAHGRGLAGPVRAEQTEHGSGGDPQVDAVQGPHLAVRLGQAADVDRDLADLCQCPALHR